MAPARPRQQGSRPRAPRAARGGGRPARRHPELIRLASLVAAAGLLAGCGGGGGGSSASATLLGRELAASTSSPNLKGDFEFGDVAYFARVKDIDRWVYASAYGTSYFREDLKGTKTGLDATKATVGLVLGAPPHTAARVSGAGIDGAKVKAALIKLGAKPGKVAGKDGVVWGAEGSTHIGAAGQFGVGPALGEFDRTIIDGHTVIAAKYTADAASLAGAGSGKSLAETAPDKQLADCLGDVVAAQGAVVPGLAGVTIAGGIRRPATPRGTVTEVLCAAGGDQARLASVARRRATLKGILPTVQLPLSRYETKIAVDRGDGWVRVTATDRPSSPPGLLLKAMAQGDAQTLFGAPSSGP